jgi:hypothetical protein
MNKFQGIKQFNYPVKDISQAKEKVSHIPTRPPLSTDITMELGRGIYGGEHESGIPVD